MYLSRHRADGGARWALDRRYLPAAFTLALLLELPAADVPGLLESLPLAPRTRSCPPSSPRRRCGRAG
jgi:hypothetical protein